MIKRRGLYKDLKIKSSKHFQFQIFCRKMSLQQVQGKNIVMKDKQEENIENLTGRKIRCDIKVKILKT